MITHLKNIALLGLERSPLQADTFEGLQALGIDVTGDEAEDLLSGLAALYVLEKTAAVLPNIEKKALPPLEEEAACRPISEESMQDFEILAAGVYPQALPVFVQTMQNEKLRFPHKKLPLVLDRCAKERWLYRNIHPVLGQRATWLMHQNDAWRMLLSVDLEKGKMHKRPLPENLTEEEKAKIGWFIEKMLIRLKN